MAVAAKISSKQLADLPARMGSRTLEVRPVGAWVQPEVIYTEDAVVIHLMFFILPVISPITTTSLNLSVKL